MIDYECLQLTVGLGSLKECALKEQEIECRKEMLTCGINTQGRRNLGTRVLSKNGKRPLCTFDRFFSKF